MMTLMYPRQTGHQFNFGTEWACHQISVTHKHAKLKILIKIGENLSKKCQVC